MITNLIQPQPLENVQLSGSIAELFNRFIDRRITSREAQRTVFAEAEEAFERCVDDIDAPVGMWQGEFWGKLAISACRVCRYQHNEELKGFLRKSAGKILFHQREDGYIGTYRDDTMVMHPSPADGQRVKGWPCDWNWNIWCRKYTLWGLLECAMLLEDDAILRGAARFADQLIEMLGRLGLHICETGTFFGVASASILKPMLILHRLTGEKRYLDFALAIADGLENDSVMCAKLIKKGLTQEPVHLWNGDIRDPDGRRTAISEKVYETLSCYDGLLELFRVTGEEKYLACTRNFFDLLMRHELDAVDSVGFNDVFVHAASVQDSITEPCDVIHLMRVASELFCLTGESRYLDVMERAFLNPFLAGVFRDGTWGARGVRASHHHYVAHNQSGMQYNHCCVNNLPRGFLNYAQCAVMNAPDGYYINFYTPGTVHAPGADFVISDGYQQHQRVTITADVQGEKSVRLRIPDWSRQTEVHIGGEALHPQAGMLCTLQLAGRAVIDIQFDAAPQLNERAYDREFYPVTPYLRRRYEASADDSAAAEYMTRCTMATLRVGPTLLAVSELLGGDIEYLKQGETVYGQGMRCTVQPAPQEDFRCAFDVMFQNAEKTVTRRMGDFASASDQNHLYSVFI